MRILHATDTYGPTVGGIEVLVHALATSQASAGHEVTVVTRTPGPTGETGRTGDTGPTADPGSTGARGRLVVRRDAEAFRELVARADVVHGHVSAYSPLALRAVEEGAKTGVPALATVHSVWGCAWPLFRGAAAVRRWTDLPIQWAAVSDVAAGPVRRALAGRDVIVVPNGVDTAYWVPALPHGHGRQPSRVTIVSVMRMSHRKRPLELLGALRRVRAAVPADVTLDVVLVGDGPLLDRVRRRIDRLGMTAWVHTPGDLDHRQLRDLYRRADVYVAPATLESFGLAALEARAAGLAIVARGGTGVTEFVQHEVDGLLSGSDRELADHLALLCRDHGLRQRLVAHNHAHAPAFDWTHVRERNLAAYLLAGAPTSPRVLPQTSPTATPPTPLTAGAARARASHPEDGVPCAAGWPSVPGGFVPLGTDSHELHSAPRVPLAPTASRP